MNMILFFDVNPWAWLGWTT